MQQFLVQDYLSLPLEPGVYLFQDEENNVLYVGKARNLRKRVASYFVHRATLGEKTRLLIGQAKKLSIIRVESEIESLLLEAALIKKYDPKYNSRLTDGKAYPLIRITMKEKYPAILTARRPDDKKSLYFGPYPSAGTLRQVLKMIRRIFPFQSVSNHPKRLCLYNHLGLCPCPPIHDSLTLQKEYKKTIRHIVQFLNGETKTIVRELEKERDELSNMEQYEEAMKVQQKIDAIHYITTNKHAAFEYEINPNLRSDLRSAELDSLREILSQHAVTTEYLHKIECYDISNTSGVHAVGSMVVFTEGEKNGSLYRRYKISKDIVGPNDFAMMEEVLRRRLKHPEWEYPNLLIVDGGKGQISSARKALEKAGLTIPLVGLAKREEIIITPDFKEIRLPRDSHALKLVMRIRDEAHRFAVTYHKKLRSKAAFL